MNDLSASIDYVLSVTGKSNLYYVGHSQGTLVAFVLLAERPEYNSKIRVANNLAAISYMKHFPTLFSRTLIEFCRIFQVLTAWVKTNLKCEIWIFQPFLETLGFYKIGVSLGTTTTIQQFFPLLYRFIYFYLFGGASSKIFDRVGITIFFHWMYLSHFADAVSSNCARLGGRCGSESSRSLRPTIPLREIRILRLRDKREFSGIRASRCSRLQHWKHFSSCRYILCPLWPFSITEGSQTKTKHLLRIL